MASKAERLAVYSKYDGCCAYCGEHLKFKEMQVDHIHPKSLNGPNNIHNYNPSCRSCNFYKSSFKMEEFRKNLKSLHLRIVKPFIARIGIKYGIVKITPFDGVFHFERINLQNKKRDANSNN